MVEYNDTTLKYTFADRIYIDDIIRGEFIKNL
jgi:hypothetical protein